MPSGGSRRGSDDLSRHPSPCVTFRKTGGGGEGKGREGAGRAGGQVGGLSWGLSPHCVCWIVKANSANAAHTCGVTCRRQSSMATSCNLRHLRHPHEASCRFHGGDLSTSRATPGQRALRKHLSLRRERGRLRSTRDYACVNLAQPSSTVRTITDSPCRTTPQVQLLKQCIFFFEQLCIEHAV